MAQPPGGTSRTDWWARFVSCVGLALACIVGTGLANPPIEFYMVIVFLCAGAPVAWAFRGKGD